MPALLTDCIGGAIPDENQTAGWGIVSKATTAPYPGAVLAKWDPKTPGSFTLTLVLPAAIGDGVDCIASPCAVYTRSSDNDDRTEDVAVPITFTPPPTTITTTTTPSTTTTTTTTSSSTTTTTTPTTPTTPTTTEGPTTSTIGGSATTVSPNSMLQTSVVAGGNQVVVFSGFTPGEGVAVTLFSDPISLPPVTADNAGTVRIEFEVPATRDPGCTSCRRSAQNPRRVGIAQFAVPSRPRCVDDPDLIESAQSDDEFLRRARRCRPAPSVECGDQRREASPSRHPDDDGYHRAGWRDDQQPAVAVDHAGGGAVVGAAAVSSRCPGTHEDDDEPPPS